MNNLKYSHWPSNYDELLKKYRKVIPTEKFAPLLDSTRTEVEADLDINGDLSLYQGNWDYTVASHLARRTLFGATPSDVDWLVSLGMEGAVMSLLGDYELPTPPINNYNFADGAGIDPNVPFGETWVFTPEFNFTGPRIVSLKGWLIKNMMAHSQPHIANKMVLFWNTILVTKAWDVFVSRASYQYFNLLYSNCLGNYKELIKAITTDPAMLIFLNGTQNNKFSPDENYARELQELFTIGKGPQSGYTESDVRETARILTGWVIDWQNMEDEGTWESFFYPDFHDTDDKTLSAFYENKKITGKSGINGSEETDALIDALFSTDELAKYVCRRIYNFFVYSVINETIEETIITPLAKIFRDNQYEIRPVMKALLSSTHFYEQSIRGAMIKNPADYLVGVMRVLSLNNPVPSDLTLDYKFHSSMLWNMANWGMEIADPPNVAGWSAYYQSPLFDKSWINTDTILRRARLMGDIIFWGFWIDENNHPSFKLVEFISTLENPGSVEKLIDDLVRIFLPVALDSGKRGELIQLLLAGNENPAYWSSAWQEWQDKQTESAKMVVENRLKQVFQLLFQTAEFQLM